MKVRLRVVTQKIISHDESLEFESVPRTGELIDLRGAPLLPEPFKNELYVVTQVSHQWSHRVEKLVPCLTLRLENVLPEESENQHRILKEYRLAVLKAWKTAVENEETAE